MFHICIPLPIINIEFLTIGSHLISLIHHNIILHLQIRHYSLAIPLAIEPASFVNIAVFEGKYTVTSFEDCTSLSH